MDFKQLTNQKKMSLYALVAFVILGTIMACFYILNTNYVVLYQNKDLANVSLVTDKLVADSVDFKLEALGTKVLVAETEFNQLKVNLAQQIQLTSKAPGFELFDNVDYSMTEQAQKITLQRAIQGELEFTLKNFQEIEEARVHITMPEKRLFSAERNQVKASVSLWIKNEMTFVQEQVAGVQELVASSVDGLLVENVVVLNGNGRQMSKESSDLAFSQESINSHKKIENALTVKAYNLLSLYFNASQLAVSITVSLDQTEQKKIIRSIIVNENNEGVITKKKESIRANDTKQNTETQIKNKNLEIEYQHGTETAERVIRPGSIEYVSVAIAIAADIDNKMVNKIEKLVFAGLGLSGNRGDQLSVETFPVINVMPKPNLPVSDIAKPTSTVKNVATSDVIEKQPQWLFIAIFGFLMLILMAGIFLRGNRSNKTEQEKLQLQFHDWLTVKEESLHAK